MSGQNSKIVIRLGEWEDKNLNPRIDGFSKLKRVGAEIPEIRIVLAGVFKEWLASDCSFPSSTEFLLAKAAQEVLDKAPTRVIMIRQAFSVPGLAKPFGPRHSATTADEAIKAIEGHFKFFLEQQWEKIKGALCIVFLQERIDPPPMPEAPKPDTILPRGGMATLTKPNVVTVQGTFGDNETITAYASDTFIVLRHPDGFFEITETTIVQKRHMLVRPPTGEKPLDIIVPGDRQLRPSLSAAEVEEAARVAFAVSEVAKMSQRVEFSLGTRAKGVLKIVFNESAPYQPLKDGEPKEREIKGRVDAVIENADDARLLVAKLKKGGEADFIYVEGSLVARQDEKALLALEDAPLSLKILYPGTQATTHRFQILRQIGHSVYLYGTRIFREGDQVKISQKQGVQVIENVTLAESTLILPLEQAFLAGLEMVGGKALRLSELAFQGIRTPGGYVITTEALESTLDQSGPKDTWVEACETPDVEKSRELFKKIRNSKLRFPEALLRQLSRALETLGSRGSLFVRSSSAAEDLPRINFAGKYKTVEDVNPDKDAVLEAYQEVIISAFSPNVVEFAREQKVDLKAATSIAALVQVDIQPIKSGVAFKSDPAGSGFVLIEAVRGKARGVVDGTRAPEKIFCDPTSEKIESKSGPKVLSNGEVKVIVSMVKFLSKMYQAPQDMEWGFDEDGQLIVLQSRDQIV